MAFFADISSVCRRPNFILPMTGFFLLCAIYYFWGWSHVLGDFGGDNAFYLLTAQYYSPWSGPSEVATFFAHNQYPPLYSLLLAVFGGGESLLAAHLVTVTCLLLGFVALYFWLRTLHQPPLTTALLVLLFALMPGTYMQALAILSENLYLFLTLACLALVAAYENDKRSHWLCLAATCLALAVLTRSAGISLLMAFLAYLILRRPPRYPLVALMAVVPVAVWNLIGNAESSGYLASLAGKYGSDPLTSLSRHLAVEIRVLWFGWVRNFTGSNVAAPLMGFLAALCLSGAFYRAYLRRLDGLYAVTYLALILVWPFPAEAQRLLFIIIPVLLAQGVLLLELFPKLRLGGRDIRSVYILFLVVFLTIIPDLALTTDRFLKPMPAELSDYRRAPDWYIVDPNMAYIKVASIRTLVSHMESIRAIVLQGECIYAIKPSIVGYFSQRISHLPTMPQFDQAVSNAYRERTNCRYVYMMAFSSPSFPEPYYPLVHARESLRIISMSSMGEYSGGPVGLLAEWARP